jgi:hypothetical protein
MLQFDRMVFRRLEDCRLSFRVFYDSVRMIVECMGEAFRGNAASIGLVLD